MNDALPIIGFTVVYGIALIARRAREKDQANWMKDTAVTLASFILAIFLVVGGAFLLLANRLESNLITSIIIVFLIVLVSEGIDKALRLIFSTEPAEQPVPPKKQSKRKKKRKR